MSTQKSLGLSQRFKLPEWPITLCLEIYLHHFAIPKALRGGGPLDLPHAKDDV